MIKGFLDGIDIYQETKNLSTQYEIKVFIQPNEYLKLHSIFNDKIEYFFGNIKDKNDCEKFTKDLVDATLYHLVGIIHPKKIKDLFEINLVGTKNITEASIKNKLNKIIVLSSNSPFGVNKSKKSPFNELSEYNPYFNYGKSKKMMEDYLKEVHHSEKIKVIIIRAMWFYGPYQPERQNLFFKMIINGKVPLVGDGTNLRSMSNVENLSYGLILANEAVLDKKDYIFWISDEKPYSQIEIINTIREILKKDFGINSKNTFLKLPNLVSTIAFLCDYILQKVSLYNSKIHVLSELNKNIYCEIEYSKKCLNYNPKIDLPMGLRRNFNWMKKNNLLNF